MSGLDSSIKNLIRVITQIQNHGGGFDFSGKSSKPYWNLCLEKFHAAYLKAKNPDGFKDMFETFFTKNIEKFTSPVVDDEGDINDEWLKNKDIMAPKNAKKKKTIDEGAFSLRNISCRGEVIYFDESNEKIRNVCIPISEAYLGACKIYATGAKNGEYSPLPAQLLLALYTVMTEVCDDEYKEEMTSNVKSLKEVVEQLTNGEEEDTTRGDTLNPLSSLISTFGKKFGMGDKMDLTNIEKTVGGLFNDDMVSKAKGIWSEFNSKVNVGDSSDLGSIINNVSEVMKDEGLQNKLKEGIAEIASNLGIGGIKLSAEDNAKIAPVDSVPTEQE